MKGFSSNLYVIYTFCVFIETSGRLVAWFLMFLNFLRFSLYKLNNLYINLICIFHAPPIARGS